MRPGSGGTDAAGGAGRLRNRAVGVAKAFHAGIAFAVGSGPTAVAVADASDAVIGRASRRTACAVPINRALGAGS